MCFFNISFYLGLLESVNCLSVLLGDLNYIPMDLKHIFVYYQ